MLEVSWSVERTEEVEQAPLWCDQPFIVRLGESGTDTNLLWVRQQLQQVFEQLCSIDLPVSSPYVFHNRAIRPGRQFIPLRLDDKWHRCLFIMLAKLALSQPNKTQMKPLFLSRCAASSLLMAASEEIMTFVHHWYSKKWQLHLLFHSTAKIKPIRCY